MGPPYPQVTVLKVLALHCLIHLPLALLQVGCERLMDRQVIWVPGRVYNAVKFRHLQRHAGQLLSRFVR